MYLWDILGFPDFWLNFILQRNQHRWGRASLLFSQSLGYPWMILGYPSTFHNAWVSPNLCTFLTWETVQQKAVHGVCHAGAAAHAPVWTVVDSWDACPYCSRKSMKLNIMSQSKITYTYIHTCMYIESESKWARERERERGRENYFFIVITHTWVIICIITWALSSAHSIWEIHQLTEGARRIWDEILHCGIEGCSGPLSPPGQYRKDPRSALRVQRRRHLPRPRPRLLCGTSRCSRPRWAALRPGKALCCGRDCTLRCCFCLHKCQQVGEGAGDRRDRMAAAVP